MAWKIITGWSGGPLTYSNADTAVPAEAEVRTHDGGFDGLVQAHDTYAGTCGEVAAALGPETLRRWKLGEPVDLAREVRELAALLDRYQVARNELARQLEEAPATCVFWDDAMCAIHRRGGAGGR